MGMERGINYVILIAVAFLIMCNIVVLDVKANAARSTHEAQEIDRKLKLLNKPAVKIIKSKDGDIIDCVDIHKQPAFDHPALKNHKIQMRPADSGLMKPSAKNESSSGRGVPAQTWQRSGHCPGGTIPIRRVRKEDLLRVDSLHHFGRRTNSLNASYATQPSDVKFPNGTAISIPSVANHATAILITVGYRYIGAQGDINVWNPRVDLPDDYTTAQIWLRAGPGESAEAGWAVNPKLYGDKRTRLFAYWTTDLYNSTGCFDLTCSGFVQTSRQVALGAALEPMSTPYGQQYQITIVMSLDPSTANWWLKFGDVVVGYWPASLFKYLKYSAIMVHWGGQVYSSKLKTPHTATAMGSGRMARNLHGDACYINNVRIVDYSLQLKYPEWVTTHADQYYCYSAYNYIKSYGVLPVFYFGGPGRSIPYCP